MYNHLIVCKQMSSGLFKNVKKKKTMHLQIIYKMFKEDLALKNLQGLICHKTRKGFKKCMHFKILKEGTLPFVHVSSGEKYHDRQAVFLKTYTF